MRARIIGAVVLVGAALAVVASTASGGTQAAEQHHRLAADGRAGDELGADREGGQRRVPEGSSRRRGQRPVPDLGEPPPEVRRDPRGRQRPGRHRDGEHRDDEVHGGRRLPGPDVRQGARSRTRARGSRGSLRPAATAASSTASRTTRARASSPTAPTCSRRPGIKVPTSLAQFTAAAKKLGAQNKQKGFSPVYIAGTDWYVAMGFVYDFGGSIATQVSGKWKGTLASPRAIAGLDGVQELLQRRLAGVARRPTRRTRTRTRVRPGPRRRRCSGRRGSAAASVTSTRTSPRSS